MSNKRIVFVDQEMAPYLTGGDIPALRRDLAVGMHKRKCEVRTFMPKFGDVNERRNQLHEVIRLSGINIPINDADHPLIIKVASLQPARIQVYFIDNDDYFQKDDDDVDYAGSNRTDNDERAIFFARGTAETLRKLKWEPGIIHCSGWISSLLPILLRGLFADDPAFAETKIVYSVQKAVPKPEPKPEEPAEVSEVSEDSEDSESSELSECSEPSELSDQPEEAVWEDPAPAPLVPVEIYRKLREENIPEDFIAQFEGQEPNPSTLHRIAIAFADAVIFEVPDPDPSLVELATERGIPVMHADEAAKGTEAFAEFYKSL